MMYPDDCITIWPWCEAPGPLLQGMDHGGDEEMVIFVPNLLWSHFTRWFGIYTLPEKKERGWSPKLMNYRCKKTRKGWIVTTAHA